MKAVKVRRPALRYHGGKWQLAPWIIEHLPPHRTYLEAYCGAASVLMRKPRSYGEVINDLDGDVVNVFRVLRDPGQASELGRLLRLTPFSREEWRLSYEPTGDPVERARRTIVRSQMGFGSDSCNANRGTGFRKNSNRRGTTPALDWSRWPEEIVRFTDRLAGVIIESKPALEVLREHDAPSTCHYVDPPYAHRVRSDIRGYSHEMTDDDHRELAACLMGLEGQVVISGYRCDLYDGLFGRWLRVDREVLVFRQSHRTESLWLNPRAASALQPRLFD